MGGADEDAGVDLDVAELSSYGFYDIHLEFLPLMFIEIRDLGADISIVHAFFSCGLVKGHCLERINMSLVEAVGQVGLVELFIISGVKGRVTETAGGGGFGIIGEV